MAKKETFKIKISLGHLYVFAPMALLYLISVGTFGHSTTTLSHYQSENKERHSRSTQRQIARLRALIGDHKTTTRGSDTIGCFAPTEDEAYAKLIPIIAATNPTPGQSMEDYTNRLPSIDNYVCGDGLSEAEVNGISKALSTKAKLTQRLAVQVDVENAPDVRMAHTIIQTYLGRDRYVEHLSNCLEKNQIEQLDVALGIDTFVASFLKLSIAQKAALQPLQEKIRALSQYDAIVVLDDKGELVDINRSRDEHFSIKQKKLLSISKEAFSILTEEQSRTYKELATSDAYNGLIQQNRLTEEYLPIPEQLQEMIELNLEGINSGDAPSATTTGLPAE